MKLSSIVRFIRNVALLARRDVTVPRIPCSRCGHTYDLHVHNRKGTDCGICTDECPAFKL